MIQRKFIYLNLVFILLLSLVVLLWQTSQNIIYAQDKISDVSLINGINDIDVEFGDTNDIIKLVIKGSGGNVEHRFEFEKRELKVGRHVFQYISGLAAGSDAQYTVNDKNKYVDTCDEKTSTIKLIVGNGNRDNIHEYDLDFDKTDLKSIELDVYIKESSSAEARFSNCIRFEKNLDGNLNPSASFKLYVVNEEARVEGTCQGLRIRGLGEANLTKRNVEHYCYDDIDSSVNIYDDIFSKEGEACRSNQYLHAYKNYGGVQKGGNLAEKYYIFAENKDKHTGNRIIVEKSSINNLSINRQITGHWEDWKNSCKDGAVTDDESYKDIRIFAQIQALSEEDGNSVGLGGTIQSRPDPNADSCNFKASSIGLGWLFCEILELSSDALHRLEGMAYNVLDIDSDTYGDEIYKDLWRSFKNIMTYAIIATALFMVISTAFDIGVFQNYTVKKYLPRLVIGTIAIQFSWALGDLMIQFVNQVGDFVGVLIFSAVPDENGTSIEDFGLGDIVGDSFASFGTSLVVGASAWAIGWVGLLPIAFTLVMGLIFGFLFLMARQFLIVFLLVLSPIGVAFWLLPGNDRAWRVYFRIFFYMLILYPVIVAVIAFGKVFAYVLVNDGDANLLNKLFALIIYIGSFAIIPFLAKQLTGVLGQLAGRVNDRSKGIIDRPRNKLREMSKQRRTGKSTNRRIARDVRMASGIGTTRDKLAARGNRILAGGDYFGSTQHNPLKPEASTGLVRKTKQRVGQWTAETAVPATKKAIVEGMANREGLPFNPDKAPLREQKREDKAIMHGQRRDIKQTVHMGNLAAQARKDEKEAEAVNKNMENVIAMATNNNPSKIKDIALDQNRSSMMRNIATKQLVKFGAEAQVRDLIEKSKGDTTLTTALQIERNNFYDAFKEIAPDLATNAFDSQGQPTTTIDGEAQKTIIERLSPDMASKMSVGTWENIARNFNYAGAKENIANNLVRPIMTNPRMRNNLPMNVKQVIDQNFNLGEDNQQNQS